MALDLHLTTQKSDCFAKENCQMLCRQSRSCIVGMAELLFTRSNTWLQYSLKFYCTVSLFPHNLLWKSAHKVTTSYWPFKLLIDFRPIWIDFDPDKLKGCVVLAVGSGRGGTGFRTYN